VPALAPEQAGVLAAEPDQYRDLTLLIQQTDSVIDADVDAQFILRHVPLKFTHTKQPLI